MTMFCGFTELSLVYLGLYDFSQFMHTSANISPFNVKKRLFLNAVCFYRLLHIFTHTTGYFDHMKPNIDP